jgi:tripartite-type tricarboxylate transporter receptor subunit TctC
MRAINTIAFAAAVGSFAVSTIALAQSYPLKTVRIIVPTGPGGGNDVQARLMAKRFSESMGQPFFVENRPGASGLIGTEITSKAPPDGYTLLVTSSLLAVGAAIYAKLPFDPIRDLVAISQITSVPQALLVHPSVPARTVKDLVALARRQPGKLNAGSPGSGSLNSIAIEMLKQAAGISVTTVPYKSGASLNGALMSGEVDFMFSGALNSLPLVRSGRAKALAVTSLKASSALPGVPTLDSFYPGFSSANWYGMFAPGATPAPIVNRLHAEIVTALKTREIREFLAGDGAEPIGSSPQEFSAHLRREIDRYAKVVKAGNLKPE